MGTSGNTIISVVDDDVSVRDAVKSLLRSIGFRVEVFSSAEEWLEVGQSHHTACLILDICMPGMSGLDLQRYLAAAQSPIPIIFITAHVAEEMCPPAPKPGVISCLHKPFSEAALFEAVHSALKTAGRDVASMVLLCHPPSVAGGCGQTFPSSGVDPIYQVA